MPPRKRPGRGFLRFFAVSCITTAWLTLILSLLLALMSLGTGGTIKAWIGMMSSMGSGSGMGSPGTGMDGGFGSGGVDPGLGGSDMGGSGLPTGAPSPQMLPSLMGPMVDRLMWIFYLGAFLNILGGICGWIFFVGLGKLTYGYLDLEEQAERDHEAVQILLANAASR